MSETMQKVKHRSRYSKRIPCQLICEDDSLTDQSQMCECDIDSIIRRYDQTGLLTHVNRMVANYGDFTEHNEYQEALNLVTEAQQNFSQLPSDLRAKFANDPGIFLEFCTNPDNYEKMVELGIAKPNDAKPNKKPPHDLPQDPPTEDDIRSFFSRMKTKGPEDAPEAPKKAQK
jgi:phage internal scaffolding protein